VKTLDRRTAVRGRTYCLYGTSDSTRGYYEAVARLADECLSIWPDIAMLLSDIRRAAKSPRRLARLARSLEGDGRRGEGDGRQGGSPAARARARTGDSPAAYALARASDELSPYLCDIDAHLRQLSLGQRSDSELTTTREQYLLYCLEVELTNRLDVEAFKAAGAKIAFLPHCLRERLDEGCKIRVEGLDYVCTSCTQGCYIDAVSRVLRLHHVQPYIWMEADLSRVLKEGARQPGGLGVLGIACLPELVAGMRRCERAHVPVVGLPLDGNCCSRWWGTMGETTVDVDRLRELLARELQPGELP